MECVGYVSSSTSSSVTIFQLSIGFERVCYADACGMLQSCGDTMQAEVRKGSKGPNSGNSGFCGCPRLYAIGGLFDFDAGKVACRSSGRCNAGYWGAWSEYLSFVTSWACMGLEKT